MIVISQKQLKSKITISRAIQSIKEAFIASSSGKCVAPLPLVFELPKKEGEICIKTALVEGLPTYTIKQVSVMNKNFKKGLPTLNATMNIYSRATGKLLAILNEEGWLTNLRTACAGAIAEEIFRKKTSSVLGIIGAGTQASWQAQVILSRTKNYKKVIIWNRTKKRAVILRDELIKKYPKIEFSVASSVDNLVSESDTIVSVTAAKSPLIRDNMIIGGKTIIGLGSDMPNKCEVDPLLYARANKIFVDNVKNNQLLGNIKRAIDSGNIKPKDISGEVGVLLCTKKIGRNNDTELILVSLVGIGAQDTCIGNLAYTVFSRISKT